MKVIKIPRKNEIRNEIPALLTDDLTISADAKMLWVKLYNSNRGKGKGIKYQEWKPTTQALATVFKVSLRTIKYWLAELKNAGWIDTIGERNCTSLIIHYTPILVQKSAPRLVSKIAPITTKDAFRSESKRNASTTITTNFTEIDEESDSIFYND